MIISKTPFRISFFGGGTDYPVWFKKNSGAVLGTTINQYGYIIIRVIPEIFEKDYVIVYREREYANKIEEITHPSVRECLKFTNIQDKIELHYLGDLPARSGLGSSSTFTVGCLNALYTHKNLKASKETLANDAIQIEQVKLDENVGSQDQIHAAFGGLNVIEFNKNGTFNVEKIKINKNQLKKFQDNFLLFYTGIVRTASNIAGEQIKETPKKEKELFEMQSFVYEGKKILELETKSLDDFGYLLNESWKLKKSLTSKISNKTIDEIYEIGIREGALGGKLLGAGGGGFVLFYANPEYHHDIINKLKFLKQVKFEFEENGSQIL